MLITPHALVGAAIGILSPHPLIAFGGGFLSHFILDYIHHHDQETYFSYGQKKHRLIIIIISVIDICIAALLLWFSIYARSWESIFLALSGACGGIILDFDNIFGKFWKWYQNTWIGEKISKIHKSIHTQTPRQMWVWGYCTQAISSFLSLSALYFF